jgi:hypothetical protein
VASWIGVKYAQCRDPQAYLQIRTCSTFLLFSLSLSIMRIEYHRLAACYSSLYKLSPVKSPLIMRPELSSKKIMPIMLLGQGGENTHTHSIVHREREGGGGGRWGALSLFISVAFQRGGKWSSCMAYSPRFRSHHHFADSFPRPTPPHSPTTP